LLIVLPFSANALETALVIPSNEIVEKRNPCETIQITTLRDSIIINLAFPLPVVSKISGYDSVRMANIPVYGAPGDPILPCKTIQVFIPQDRDVEDVLVTDFDKKTLEGKFTLEYGKTLRPMFSNTAVPDHPNLKVYGSANPFPNVYCSHVSEQHLRGFKILPLTIYPIQYIPKNGEISYFETMTITISLNEADEFSPLLRKTPQDKDLVANIVDNPDDVESWANVMTYSQPTSLVNASDSYNYVIVTSSALQSSFQPLVNWKILKGLNATIALVEDIKNCSDYNCDGLYGDGCGSKFNDTAAHIRNFIKDAYSNWGTEYVLLGGDDEIIPARGVYAFVGEDVDRNIPCDMYYGALDGSWDNDNDTIFGEGVFEEGPENATAGEEADFFAEVYIGRATVETAEEAANFVNKILAYEQNPDASYLNKALMIGEELDDETVGGNGKDLVTDIIPQYTTTRLYDRDGTFSASAVVSKLNGGTHIVNHDGHANSQFVMGLGTSSVDSLTNTEYFMVYSLGCYAAAFDQGGVSGESIAEHFIFNPSGAFAFIGNSRYGWYFSGMTVGPGEVFDRSFFSTLNSGTRNLGKALQVSKENQYSGNVHRWTYFNLNLLGDPETEIVTDFTVPTAHFKTITNLLNPPVFKGAVDLEGTAKNGTAVGASFANFTIDFGYGKNPSSWSSEGITLTNNGQVQIVNDVLAAWNINLITPATYTLRLRVLDLNGTIGEDRWIIRVAAMPAVCVNPKVIEVQAGLTFTVDFNITNIEDLYSLDIKIGWNATLMDYVNHTITIPVEQNPGGILYMPASITKNKLNQTAGTYQIAAKSVEAASPFTGSGTVFRMIFEAKTNSSSFLQILSTELTDRYLQPLPHIILNGIVNIAPGSHNVAVTAISSGKRNVGCGYTIRINVTAANRGTFTENFNLTIYANGTATSTALVLLCGNNSKEVTIIWNTTGWVKGNYTISAYAHPVLGEINTTDNTLVNGWIFVTIPGDVDGDRDVDIYDVVKITGIYGSKCGDPQFNPNSDLDDDGQIKIYDVVRCTSHYGQEW